jgi:UDP-N-acetylmuramate--alanine ligase
MQLNKIKYAYFLGIGGIGMSAIARYFIANGIKVAGYDKTPSDLTNELIEEGIDIHFTDAAINIPQFVFDNTHETLLIYTPAIPKDHKEFLHLISLNYKIYKRSEVLGMISRDSFCIAVAGTHGKTTTSTLIAHLLYSCGINFTAFLGGISSNYNTNYIHKSDGINLFDDLPIVVLEADEFDRSFHQLNPDIAVITAIDPDHLDIYENETAFRAAFEIFASKIKEKGNLIFNAQLNQKWPAEIRTISYGIDNNVAAFNSNFVNIDNGYFVFNYTGKLRTQSGLHVHDLLLAKCGLPGFHNIENATAALGLALNILDLNRKHIRAGLESFAGVRRRFEFVVRNDNYTVIDDYAHHPEEINAIISSVKKLYPNKKLTCIFQPHLFTRTRDFAEGFAENLAKADAVILMEIYPARELPIPTITSEWLLEKIKINEKFLLKESEILEKIKIEKPELLLILGAGDIDRIVPKIKEVYGGF